MPHPSSSAIWRRRRRRFAVGWPDTRYDSGQKETGRGASAPPRHLSHPLMGVRRRALRGARNCTQAAPDAVDSNLPGGPAAQRNTRNKSETKFRNETVGVPWCQGAPVTDTHTCTANGRFCTIYLLYRLLPDTRSHFTTYAHEGRHGRLPRTINSLWSLFF